jgi:alkylresorcinol/alkylpyrone synthase
MARIVSISTAVPSTRLNCVETERLLRQQLQAWEQPEELYLKILKNTKVEYRHTVYGSEEVISDHPFTERNDLYIQTCIELGERCTRAALADSRLRPSDIASVISSSCTGFMIPALDAHLIERLEMSRAARRLPITELGCAAGAMGLTRAWEQLQVYPQANVLLLAVELPSLTFQPNDRRPSQVIASLIFADGAAAAVLANAGVRPSPRLLGGRTFTIPGTLDDMGYRMDEKGLHIILTPQIPQILHDSLDAEIDALLNEHSVSRTQIRWCAMHPGSPKVIELAQDKLKLSPERLRPSWTVLKNYGNGSSAAVLFVLDEMLRNPTAESGELGLIMAFGPGVSGEILLARWEA